MDAPLVEVETDKAVVEIPSPRAGVLLDQGAAEGALVEVGQVLAVIGEPGEELEPSPSPSSEAAGGPSSPREGEGEGVSPSPTTAREAALRVQALPVVRKLAKDLGVDLARLQGSGPAGRIQREDVEAAARAKRAIPDGEERVQLSKLRRTISEHLARSWREIPHVTTFGEAEAGRLLAARRALAARRDGPLPLEAFLIMAVLPALRVFPEFNASLDGDELVLKRRYDIGVAVDTPDGLIVPVVKGADARDLIDLAEEVARLAQATQGRRVTPDELAGATFTLSNIGALGGGYGTPIIPYGTTAILSVGKAEDRVVVRDGRMDVAPLLPLSLSFDHRVIDGAAGRRFLTMVAEYLEEPALFLAGAR